MDNAHQEHAKVFKALCDPKRLAILSLLRGGEKCACVLMDQLGMAQSAVSYHMKILCESGIVVSRQEHHIRIAGYSDTLLFLLVYSAVYRLYQCRVAAGGYILVPDFLPNGRPG